MKKKFKRSIVWDISHEELQKLLDESDSIVSILKKIGFEAYNGSGKTLSRRLKEEEFDMETFNDNKKIKNSAGRNTRKDFTEIFCENSTYTHRSGIKKYMLELGIEYKCVICGIEDTYNGKPISLQLDHMNGINDDNRLENLRFLCPNCHSQTENYAGRNVGDLNQRKCECGNKKCSSSIACLRCNNKKPKKKKIEWQNKEYFEKRVWELPIIKIASELGVSDVAVNKYLKKLGIAKPPRGYWLSLKSI